MPAILVLTLFHVLMNVVAIVAGAGPIRRLIANGDDRSLVQWFPTTIAVAACDRLSVFLQWCNAGDECRHPVQDPGVALSRSTGEDWRASGSLSMWRCHALDVLQHAGADHPVVPEDRAFARPGTARQQARDPRLSGRPSARLSGCWHFCSAEVPTVLVGPRRFHTVS